MVAVKKSDDKEQMNKCMEDRAMMNEKNFIRAEEVAEILDVSKSYAYKIVQRLNAELKAKAYLTVSGRVSRQYFLEKVCYGGAAGDRNDRAYHDSGGE